ncbi:annexin A13-like [Diadema antillarum]|uniref:annexin A13-like n=1 Tax=Diadema antillarum TaxID=105358 RepID=UPI003A837260
MGRLNSSFILHTIQPTVVKFPGFDKDSDAQALRKAMSGLGTDEKQIIEILCNRSNAQRQVLKAHYKATYGRDLVRNLKSELSGDFEDVIIGLMDEPAKYDARCLKKAMRGAGTDEAALLEILCARNNAEIAEIRKAYQDGGYGDLEKDLKSDTSGDLERLLVGLSVGARDEHAHPDGNQAMADAKALYEAGAAQWGTDESEFQRILVGRSFGHLRLVFRAYEEATGTSLKSVIKSEMSGDLKRGYLNIIKFIDDPVKYYVHKLHKAMKGAGTDESCLVRIFVMRCEVDLADIRHAYQAKYGRELKDDLEKEVSGDFKNALLALLH